MNIVSYILIPISSLLVLGCYTVTCDNEHSVATSGSTSSLPHQSVENQHSIDRQYAAEGGTIIDKNTNSSLPTAVSKPSHVTDTPRKESLQPSVGNTAVRKISARKEAIFNQTESPSNITKTSPNAPIHNQNETTVKKDDQKISHNSTSKPNTASIPIVKKPTVTFSVDGDESEYDIHKIETPVEHSQLHVVPQSKLESHRNLIVPIVIAVFTLPLFSVLGYYAVKHGREAWKNRHYRRMDFLLDGMYND